MARYKIGDNVRIREDLEIGKWYTGLVWLPNMQNRMAGKVVRINEISPNREYLTSAGFFVNNDMIKEKINVR